jgi:predicted dehydrogenase
MSSHRQLRIAQVGVGYWGKNLLRNFASLPGVEIAWACDVREDMRVAAEQRHPGLRTTGRLDDILEDTSVDALVIATETPRHFLMADAALRAGLHVFVEKPLAQTVAQAERLVEEAGASGRVLMVGHLLRYHPAFAHVESMARAGELGDIRYLYTVRVNLGIVRSEENAFDSLAPHDLALAVAMIPSPPVAVTATGRAFLQAGVEDVVFATVEFENGALAHVHVSWLDPLKERRLTVVGDKRMAVVDDMEPADKVRIYDRGVDVPKADDPGAFPEFGSALAIRSGDIHVPRIPAIEPLRAECEEFVSAIRDGRPARTDGSEGLSVVRLLEAARTSLRAGGSRVEV